MRKILGSTTALLALLIGGSAAPHQGSAAVDDSVASRGCSFVAKSPVEAPAQQIAWTSSFGSRSSSPNSSRKSSFGGFGGRWR